MKWTGNEYTPGDVLDMVRRQYQTDKPVGSISINLICSAVARELEVNPTLFKDCRSVDDIYKVMRENCPDMVNQPLKPVKLDRFKERVESMIRMTRLKMR